MKKTQSIVILHGWNLSGSRYEYLGRVLKDKGYRVHLPDFPGFGITKLSKPYSLDNYVEFLDRYLSQNGLVKPILIGHSFGGRVALKYEFLYPKKAKALILTGTPGLSPIPGMKRKIFTLIAKVGKAFCLLPPLIFFLPIIRKYYYIAAGAGEYARAKGPMRQTFKNIVQENLGEYMKSVSVPCLLVWGQEDRMVPLPIAVTMRRIIPAAQMKVIPDCDHGVPYHAPNKFYDAMDEFLSSL